MYPVQTPTYKFMKNRNSQFSIFSFDADVDKRTLKGYAIVFNQLSKINEDSAGKWATRISKKLTLQPTVDVYYEHDKKQILASTKNKSLSLKTDDKGVYFEFSLGNTQLQNDVYELVKQGLINQMSFGVEITKSKWTKETFNGEEIDVRNVEAGNVFEISAVHSPAFEATNLMVASNDDPERKHFIKKKSFFNDDDPDEKEIKMKLWKYLQDHEAEKKAKAEAEEAKKIKEAEEQKQKEEENAEAEKLALAKAKLKLMEMES